MKTQTHILLIDPIPFLGGSKIACQHMLEQIDASSTTITVLTNDQASWKDTGYNTISLYRPRWLPKTDHGIGYFLRQFITALNILFVRLFTGKIDTLLGASGPGVDLSIHIVKQLLDVRTVQIVNGPVSHSKALGWALSSADQVFFLASIYEDIVNAITKAGKSPDIVASPRFKSISNGIPRAQWPSDCQTSKPVLFWAASLVKWKGLETLFDALELFSDSDRPETHICYIRPQNTDIEASEINRHIAHVSCHEKPANLDQIRAGCNIFVSTSKNEPFGISILEAMAAGHCIVIPADAAYWDQQLTNGVDCIKYAPGDHKDLARKLDQLCCDMDQVMQLGSNAQRIAAEFRAEHVYRPVAESLIPSKNSRTDLSYDRGNPYDI
ncbi:glycosyltransferase family 4 protein [Parasalinivibrio latis]|uniref:glycosyltransferase family 4 protein n=1 Tax=Parasalinivibrio latis TaxID=2952610 RepID=UPI0030E44811